MTAVTRLSESAQHSLEGRVLGGFRLAREIACGGMATVYLAHKLGPGGVYQPAAVKVIHPHLARDNDFVDMFLDEARIVSCISHPNVSRVLDFGQAEGTYYLAMEYVMGETWGEMLSALKATPDARGIMPALLSQVLAQACEGLHAAHEACGEDGRPLNIVHRDVSPQNLIVGYDGSVRVLDFGIASATEKLHNTRHGTVKGRFAYMAPEQMRGHAVDRRADIWSLGVMLWEGLARERLFKRETEAETVLAVTSDPLPSLEGRKPPVPSALNQIAMQALSRERDQRFATARELGLELARFASGGLVQVGLPDVSLWMQRLFRERIALKQALLRSSATTANREVIAAAPGPPASDDETPTQHSESRVSQGLRSLSVRATMPSISMVREVAREKSFLKGFARGVLGACVMLALSALGWFTSAHRNDEPVDARATTTSTKQIGAAKPEPTSASAAASKDESPAPAATTPAAEDQSPAPAPTQPAAEDQSPAPAAAIEQPSEPSVAEPAREQAGSPHRSSRAAKRTKEEVPTDMVPVNIVTPGGWADVYLKGVWLGTTPARIELPVGRHVLTLRAFGDGAEIVRKIELTKDNPLKLKVTVD